MDQHVHNWSPWYQIPPLHGSVEYWQKACDCGMAWTTTRNINEGRSIYELASLAGI